MITRMDGLEKTVKIIHSITDKPTRHNVLYVVSTYVQKKVSKYPPESGANMPPGLNNYSWYERRLGTRTKYGKLYRTSQVLENRWDFGISDNAKKAVITNTASYAPYVHDEDYQPGFHRRRGWQTYQDVIQRERDNIDELALIEIERAMNNVS